MPWSMDFTRGGRAFNAAMSIAPLLKIFPLPLLPERSPNKVSMSSVLPVMFSTAPVSRSQLFTAVLMPGILPSTVMLKPWAESMMFVAAAWASFRSLLAPSYSPAPTWLATP